MNRQNKVNKVLNGAKRINIFSKIFQSAATKYNKFDKTITPLEILHQRNQCEKNANQDQIREHRLHLKSQEFLYKEGNFLLYIFYGRIQII